MKVLLSIISEKQCTQSYVDLEKKCHLICSVWTAADQFEFLKILIFVQ